MCLIREVQAVSPPTTLINTNENILSNTIADVNGLNL